MSLIAGVNVFRLLFLGEGEKLPFSKAL